MSLGSIRAGLRAALAAGLVAPAALAGNNDPGSLLVFPDIDNRPGSVTFVTITNTNGDPVDGSVRVHIVYVEAEDCSKSNAFINLTPLDTITTFTTAHAPSHQQGFAYAYALSMQGSPVDFDHLIGSEMVLDGYTASEYSTNAMVWEGQTGPGNPTELNGNGLRDLDGNEYEQAPDRIAIPRFLGQNPLTPMVRGELVVLGLSGGRAFTTSLSFLIFNDNEETFSAEHTFYCWDRVPLLNVSGAFRNDFLHYGTNNAPNEIVGMPGLESGWILIDGASATSSTTTIPDPAFLAVLVETGRLSSSSLPFTIGRQDNGKLLPSALNGQF